MAATLIQSFPPIDRAPREYKGLDGGCGVLATWGVLKYFNRPVDVPELITRCEYSKKDGVLAVAIALALHHYGLNVEYFSDPDPHSNELEKKLTQKASILGLGPRPSIGIEDLLNKLSTSAVSIVLYRSRIWIPHLSPLIGSTSGGELILPYGEPPQVSKEEFERQWNGERIYRTCIVASIKL